MTFAVDNRHAGSALCRSAAVPVQAYGYTQNGCSVALTSHYLGFERAQPTDSVVTQVVVERKDAGASWRRSRRGSLLRKMGPRVDERGLVALADSFQQASCVRKIRSCLPVPC